jgi:hypothetical protein
VRLIGDSAAGVVADGSRFEPGSQTRGEVARGTVVARHDDRRVVRIAIQQGGDQVRPQCLGDEAATAVARERVGLDVVIGVGEKRAEHYLLSLGRRSVAEYHFFGYVGRGFDQLRDLVFGLGEPAQDISRDALGIGR